MDDELQSIAFAAKVRELVAKIQLIQAVYTSLGVAMPCCALGAGSIVGALLFHIPANAWMLVTPLFALVIVWLLLLGARRGLEAAFTKEFVRNRDLAEQTLKAAREAGVKV